MAGRCQSPSCQFWCHIDLVLDPAPPLTFGQFLSLSFSLKQSLRIECDCAYHLSIGSGSYQIVCRCEGKSPDLGAGLTGALAKSRNGDGVTCAWTGLGQALGERGPSMAKRDPEVAAQWPLWRQVGGMWRDLMMDCSHRGGGRGKGGLGLLCHGTPITRPMKHWVLPTLAWEQQIRCKADGA